MRLNELKPNEGSTKKRRRVGRGNGSGWGKTAARGQNGQKSRSGGSIRPGFEGGQMPLQRRLPKRGFNNIFKKEYAVVNLGSLEETFEAGMEITPELLVETGLIKKINDGVKVLAEGDLSKSFTIKAHKFSQSSLEKIEAAGGKAEVI